MKVLLLIVAVLLILISLLQGGKSDAFQNVKERGPEKVISIITMVLGIIFFALVIIIRISE